jgi:hypothetical protein
MARAGPSQHSVRVGEIESSSGMRFLFVRDGVGTLRLALAKGEILAGSFVERDH